MQSRKSRTPSMGRYTKQNNELVEKFQECRTSHLLSKSFMDLWKSLIKLPYHETNVSLILTSSCNLILSQLTRDHIQLNLTEVSSIAYKTLNKIVWWEASLCHLDSYHDLLEEISMLLERFINQEEDTIFHENVSLLIWLCILIYLSTSHESVLELTRKAVSKGKTIPQTFRGPKKHFAFIIPFCDNPIQRNQEATDKSIFEIAELVTATESLNTEKYPNTEIISVRTRQFIALLKILRNQEYSNVPKQLCSTILHEFLRDSSCNSVSCLSSSVLAAHLSSSVQPSLTIKLLSLSLQQAEESQSIIQASAAVNLVKLFQILREPSLEKDVLQSAERKLLSYAMSADESSQTDKNLVSLSQLLTIPSPCWVQFKLARVLLQEKCYYEAACKYYEILNTPLCSNAEEERKLKASQLDSPDVGIVLHEYALALLLSNKLGTLKQLLLDTECPDFVMLILKTDLLLKLKMDEFGIQTLKRAILDIEASVMDANFKAVILNTCHSRLEHLALRRCVLKQGKDMSKPSPLSIVEPNLNCPSCNGTLPNQTHEKFWQYSKDLAICHLFHEL